MPITSTNQQAALSLASAAPGNSAIGDAAAAGTSGSVARADHVHGREAAGTPGASAVGDTAAAGSATTVARSDHRHSREAFGTPVNLDASVTSLSAGSLTTVARADHIHTLSKVSVLLASYTVSTAAASIQIASGIDGRFRNLHLLIRARSNYAGSGGIDTCSLQFNGDTGTNYYGAFGNQTSCPMFYLNAQANYGPINTSSVPSTASIIIHDYSVTGSMPRVCSGMNCYNNNVSAYSMVNGSWYGAWINTSQAITSITVLSIYGQIVSGSTFQLYGMY